MPPAPNAPDPAARCIMVMGPSGAGKTTLARALAQRIGAAFIEGDDHHPPENRARMRAGQPLTEAMRRPWLDALSRAVRASRAVRPTVFTCSALRRSHRDALRDRIGPMQLILPQAPADLIRARMQARTHFAPPALLDSQLAIFQPPTPDEGAIRLDMRLPLDVVLEQAVAALAGPPP